MRRVVLVLVSGLVGVSAWPGTASAADPVCGTTPEGGSQPVKATLALADTDPETVTAAQYGRRTGVKHLALVYTVSGCQLAGNLPVPEDPPPIGPPKDVKASTIPKGVVRLDGAPQIDGDQYVVRLQVFTSPPDYTDSNTNRTISPKFEPGTYGGFVQLNADWMHRTGTPIEVSRSENRWLFVLGASAAGAIGGFVFFMLLHAFSRAQLLAGPGKIAIAGLVSLGVGVYVAYTTNYLNQDVWTFGANTIALLTAGFTAATSGHLVTGLLGKVYDDHAKVNPAKPRATKDASGKRRAGVARRMRHPLRAGEANGDEQAAAAGAPPPDGAGGSPP